MGRLRLRRHWHRRKSSRRDSRSRSRSVVYGVFLFARLSCVVFQSIRFPVGVSLVPAMTTFREGKQIGDRGRSIYLFVCPWTFRIVQCAFMDEACFPLEFAAAVRGVSYRVVRFGGCWGLESANQNHHHRPHIVAKGRNRNPTV